MNTDLFSMIGEAEGRYLNDGERERIRTYALGIGPRLEVARRLAEVEDAVVGQVVTKFFENHTQRGADANIVGKTRRDCRFVLRYVAQAHARDDIHFFREQFVDWMIPIFEVFVDHDELVEFFALTRQAVADHIDPADMPHLEPYFDAIDKEMSK